MATARMNASVVSTIDLGPDIPGYQLRMRNLVLEPGGTIPMHNHKNRPALSYVLEGTLTTTTPDGSVHEHKQGETVTETRDLVHAGENRGSDRTVIVSVDIVKKR